MTCNVNGVVIVNLLLRSQEVHSLELLLRIGCNLRSYKAVIEFLSFYPPCIDRILWDILISSAHVSERCMLLIEIVEMEIRLLRVINSLTLHQITILFHRIHLLMQIFILYAMILQHLITVLEVRLLNRNFCAVWSSDVTLLVHKILHIHLTLYVRTITTTTTIL